MSQKKRKYHDNYLDFGFTYLIKDDLQIPQCVVCMKTFSNSTMKPAQIYPISHSYLSMSDILQMKGLMRNFCSVNLLETTSVAVDVLQKLIDFFDETEFSWSKLVGVCTDGAPAMIGANSGLISLVKQKNPEIQKTHCMFHKAALVSKTIPKKLHEHISVVIKVVNFVKSSALNTRLFSKLCRDMDADHTALLHQTQVRWLSKGNMLYRIFQTKRRSQVVFSCKTKTRVFVGIRWRRIFYILSLPC